MGYLIGEKRLTFLEVSESDQAFRAEVPAFVSKIREISPPDEIAEFMTTPRRLGPTGHTMSDEDYQVFREADSTNEPSPAAARLIAFEWAQELLLDDNS